MFNVKKNKAFAELRDMLPVYVTANVIVVCISAVFALRGELRTAVLLTAGTLAGTCVSVLNLLGIGYTARLAVQQQAQKRAAFICNAGYGIRYAGMAVIFAALLLLKAVNLIALFVPLFVPKIYYTFVYTYKMKHLPESLKGVE